MTSTILDSLEDIAYLAAHAASVEDRRFLDLVLQATETTVIEVTSKGTNLDG